MESRIYGEKVSIDPGKVNAFFEQRACVGNPLASVMLRPGDDGIAEKRNAKETALLTGLLQGSASLRVLDLGCGVGRWLTNIETLLTSYVGVDFSENYITTAKQLHANKKGSSFFHCSVVTPDKAVLLQQYDLVIINGLCPYLNDEDVNTVFTFIFPLLSPKGAVYCRESVSMIGERLTLKEYFSEDLQAEYSAIYRTPEEYAAVFKNTLPGCSVRFSEYLLDEDTGARKETNQKYWFLQRR